MQTGLESPRGAALWRQEIRRREAALRGDLAHNAATQKDSEHDNTRNRIEELLDDAHHAANSRFGPLRWWSGAAIDESWTAIHEAEEEYTAYVLADGARPLRFCQAAAAARVAVDHGERSGLDNDDMRVLKAYLERAEVVCKEQGRNRERAATQLALRYPNLDSKIIAVMRSSHQRDDRTNVEARSLRNRLLLLSILLIAAVATVTLISWRWEFSFLTFATPVAEGDASAAETAAVAPWIWVLTVAVFGAIGGLLTSIHLLSEARRDPSPFHLPYHQALVKLTAGACTAIIGLVLVAGGGEAGGGIVGGIQLTAMPAVLAFAVLFGAGQNYLTSALDRRAADILSGATAKDDEPDAGTPK